MSVSRKASTPRRSVRSRSTSVKSNPLASPKHGRQAAVNEILRTLDPFNENRAYVPGLLYVVNAATWNNSAWYFYVVKRAKELGFNAVARYEIAPSLSMSELNVTHLLIARADAILFDLTEMTPATGYQVGYAFAIGNLSTDVVVMKNASYFDALQILCPYNITAYSDKVFRRTLNEELMRILRTRSYLHTGKSITRSSRQPPSSRLLK
jgi:hypothetical protein